MTINQPLQRVDLRWDYTATNSAGTFPIGYCTDSLYQKAWADLPDVIKAIYENEDIWDKNRAKHLARVGNYHTDGHATADEAVACFRRYEVLEHTHLYRDQHTKERCKVCESWTDRRVRIGEARVFPVCENCQNEENFLKLNGARQA